MNCPNVPTPPPLQHGIPGGAAAGFIRSPMPRRAMAQTTEIVTPATYRGNCSVPLYRKMIRWKHATLIIHRNNIYIASDIYAAFRPV